MTVREQLEAVAESLLRPYIERLKRSAGVPEARVVNDPIWRTIRLEPWEVAIVDSPLMQRLRTVRQLGVVHWVYPSAIHTRFEHSLGAMHCAAEILVSLEHNSGRVGHPLVNDNTFKLVRMAALLHDCGHTVMSHVGERIAERLPGMDEYREGLAQDFAYRKKPSVSEAIAVGLIRSPAFCELLACPQVGADFVMESREAAEEIARLVLGAPAKHGPSFLSLVISGAFDADKLDYMVRDCFMAGVPCAVDVARAIGKLHCIEVPADANVEGIAEYRTWARTQEGEPVHVLALPRSAVTVLNELAVTRTTLYEKIYFHPKVRVLEALVCRALDELSVADIKSWMHLSDEGVLALPGFRRLRDRDLPKRAFQCSRTDAVQGSALRQLSRALETGDFERAVVEEAERARTVLGSNGQTPCIIADEPNVRKMKLDVYAFIGDSALDLTQVSAAVAGQRAEAGKFLSRERIYVFTDADARIPVCLAARKVAARYGIVSTGADDIPLKIEPLELAEASTKLERTGFFEGGPGALKSDVAVTMPSRQQRHLEDFLRTARARTERVAASLGQYQAVDGRRMDVVAVADFLRQFQSRGRARAALHLLEEVKLVGRNELASALRQTLATAGSGGESVCVCPLGGLADSSSHLAYLMLDLPAADRRPVLSLPEALQRVRSKRAQRLLLWDDFCGTGRHSLTVLGQWLNLAKGGDELDEQHVEPLLDSDFFRSADILIGFARARQAGLTGLEAWLADKGLTNVKVHRSGPNELIPDRDDVFDSKRLRLDPVERDELRAFLQDKGRQLLARHRQRTERPWSEQNVEDRLLGYGNNCLLIAFPHNVPTVTLTALWDEDGSWRALLPRRPKPAGPANG